MTTEADQIVAAIDRLTNVTTTSLNLSYLLAFALNIIPVIFGALVGYWLTNRHWNKIEEERKLVASAKEIEFILNEIEDQSVGFWCRECDEDTQADSVAHTTLSSKILMSSQLVTEFLSNDKIKKDVGLVTKLNLYLEDIFELATGEDFESSTRNCDKSRATLISRRCSEARTKLAKYR